FPGQVPAAERVAGGGVELLAVSTRDKRTDLAGVIEAERREGRHRPQLQRAVGAAGEVLRVLRLKADGRDGLVVGQEFARRLVVAGVPQVQPAVVAAGGD